MINYIPFYTHIWSDKDFKKISINARFLFIYLFGNDAVTLTGIYELDLDVCKIKIRLNDSFENAFNELIEIKKFIEWDANKDLIWIINRFKLIPTKSPKVIMGAVKELNTIGDHPFKEKFIARYKSYVEPFLYKLKESDYSAGDFLKEEQLFHLAKLYPKKTELKKFLMNRGCAEEKIDQVLLRVLPNIK